MEAEKGEAGGLKRRGLLNRAISFVEDRGTPESEDPEEDAKYKTATPSLMARWRSLKRGPSRRRGAELQGNSRVDDIIFLDSYEETQFEEELSITVCKEMIRQNLIDLMKAASGNVQLVTDLEVEGKITPQNVYEVFKGSSPYERNVAFLMAIFLRRKDLTEFFLSAQVDIGFYEPRQGFGALHLSGFSGCVHCTGYLINQGADVNILLGSYTPLHCAAFGNSVDTARMLLKAGAKTTAVEAGSEQLGCNETVMHSAVRARSLDVIQLFIEESVDVNNTGQCGLSPLHLAADLGYAQCMRVLLASGRCDINLKTSEKKNTALHLAAEGGFIDCVKLLLDHGADPNTRNHRSQTPLHVASKTCLECVEEILKRGGNPNSHDADNRTPLHVAVCKSELTFGYEITNCLVSWKADVNRADKYGYTPLHIAALNNLTECVECLILNGACVTSRTRGGATALSILVRKTPTAVSSITEMLDKSIQVNEHDPSRAVALKFNFRYLLQNCRFGEISFLQTFVDEGQKEMLEHPLCEAFLYLKWQKMRKYYIARLLFGLVLVLLLSLYVLMALAYECYNDHLLTNIRSRFLSKEPNETTLCSNSSSVGRFLRDNPRVIEGEYYVLAFITMLEICRKLYGFCGYKSVKDYIKQPHNLIEWFVVVSVFLISFIYEGKTFPWQNHVGAMAVLCGWTNIMFMIGHLPIFGSYVTMYTRVQAEFAKLFLAYLCLLLGFTVCFCVIFPKATEFSDPFVGIVKILVMMTGELEFSDLLANITEEGSSLLKMSALIVFVFFLLFVTIILMNLLIGIAVHDIQGLQKTAGLQKLVGQIELIAHIESALFNGCTPACFVKLLRATALISPSAYRVVISVQPLDPRENRLPKEVMRAGLDLARPPKTRGGSTVTSVAGSMKRATYARRSKFPASELEGDARLLLLQLLEEVRSLKNEVASMQEKRENEEKGNCETV